MVSKRKLSAPERLSLIQGKPSKQSRYSSARGYPSDSEEEVDYNRLDGGDGSDEDAYVEDLDDNDLPLHARLAAERRAMLRVMVQTPRTKQDVADERAQRAKSVTAALKGQKLAELRAYLTS